MYLQEKETVITFDDSSDIATIYTCTQKWKTKLRKCEENDTLNCVHKIKEDEYSVTYELPKKLISLRTPKPSRQLTEEQRKAATERLRRVQENKRKNNT